MALRQQAALAASTGTIADWVYGDGLADSGTGAVLHTDEISFTARWGRGLAGWLVAGGESVCVGGGAGGRAMGSAAACTVKGAKGCYAC